MAPAFTTAPRIETDRLVLRAARLDDFEPFRDMVGDPEVTRHLGGPMSDPAQAWEKFVRIPGFWALLGFGLWIVEDKASGRVAGQAGFGLFQRAIDPPLPEIPEGAWVFARWAQGRGFGSEAMAAAFAWADANLPDRGYVCIIAPDNAASLGLARRCGFVETRRAPHRDEETVVLERSPLAVR